MKQASRKTKQPSLPFNFSRRLREGIFILVSAISLFLLLSLATYHQTDPGWSSTGDVTHVANAGGKVGAWLSDFLLYLFGYMAYLFPVILAITAWNQMKGDGEDKQAFNFYLFAFRFLGFFLIMLSGAALANLEFSNYHPNVPFTAGGILGDILAPYLVSILNVIGTTLFLIALFATGITLLSGMSWSWLGNFFGVVGNATIFIFKKIFGIAFRKREKQIVIEDIQEDKKEKSISKRMRMNREPVISDEDDLEEDEEEIQLPQSVKKVEPVKPKIIANIFSQKPKQKPLFKSTGENDLPSIDLLDAADHTNYKGYSHAKLEEMSREVEIRLKDFGVDVQVVAVHPGPVITRFELQLAPGLKVSRISGLAKDLARSLSVTSVRVVDVIPGKTVVGLELPNENREIVRLSEILSSQQYEQMRSPLALALGKDIAGHPVIVDLAKMPHLLVAGTTGSGKSVGVNAMLLGLLYKSTPVDVRMILVDPKMLELSIYEGIPHLLTPVVTDMKEAANALRWCVFEMERRYRLMAAMGVRNLAGYNVKIKDAEKNNMPLPDPTWRGQPGETCPALTTLPYIVVVIDEYADMMMVVGKKVEQLIARIAQKARAAGIHLILATQRPSVDVVTGLIKANIPTRIAFQVSSKIDSRTVLDQGGAEQLLGNGDLLYLPPGTSVPVRVHGAFVADHEVHSVVEDWKQRGAPEYLEEITTGSSAGSSDALNLFGDEEGGESSGEQDPLYDEAVNIVVTSRKASISNIQRRLKIGYNRAARLVEDMEKAGLVSPMESNGTREILVPAREEV